VGASFAISVAVHGVLLGTLTFQVSQAPSEAPDGAAEPVAFQDRLIELVQIEEVVKEVILEPIIAQARPALATPTPEELPQPAPGDVSVAKAGETPPSDAVTGVDVHAQGDAFPSTTMLAEAGPTARLAESLRPRFGMLKELPKSARRPVAMLDPHEGHDHGEGDGREEESWWDRLGRKLGFGGGEICRPRPELIVDEEKPDKDKDEDEKKPDKTESSGS
jgi:hypothetical protein